MICHFVVFDKKVKLTTKVEMAMAMTIKNRFIVSHIVNNAY